MTKKKTRRNYLTTVASLTTIAVAGCSSGEGGQGSGDEGSNADPGEPTDTEAPEPIFDEFSFEGTDLKIGLANTESVSSITVIGPDGEEYASEEVAAGVEVVSVGFGQYQPGEYQFVAVDDEDSEISSVVQEFVPEFALRRLSTGQNEGYDVDPGCPFLVVENTGTGPLSVDWLAFDHDRFSRVYWRENKEDGPPIQAKDRTMPFVAPPGETIEIVLTEVVLRTFEPPTEPLSIEPELSVGANDGEHTFTTLVEYTNTTGDWANELEAWRTIDISFQLKEEA